MLPIDTERSSIIEDFGARLYELDPIGAIIENFSLRRQPQQRGGRFYQDVAAYGHFGRSDLNLPWEDVELIATKLKG